MTHGRPGGTVTPEAVRLHADVARLGSRSIALLVDGLIQGILLVPVLFGFFLDGLADTVEAVVAGLFVFAIVWLYFPLFEWLWSGQTPGKRVQRIRVVRTSGEPAGFAPVMVRNLLRVLEVYLLPFIAVTSMFFTARSQRLGDLAAGTMVIRDRAMPAPDAMLTSAPAPWTPALDVSGVTAREYALLRTFLSRRYDLDPAARQQLAASLAAMARRQLGAPPGGSPLSDEQLIEAVFNSYRARFASRGE